VYLSSSDTCGAFGGGGDSCFMTTNLGHRGNERQPIPAACDGKP